MFKKSDEIKQYCMTSDPLGYLKIIILSILLHKRHVLCDRKRSTSTLRQHFSFTSLCNCVQFNDDSIFRNDRPIDGDLFFWNYILYWSVYLKFKIQIVCTVSKKCLTGTSYSALLKAIFFYWKDRWKDPVTSMIIDLGII